MPKLTIEITSENGEFIESLEEIKSKIESGFIIGSDQNNSEFYSFEIK